MQPKKLLTFIFSCLFLLLALSFLRGMVPQLGSGGMIVLVVALALLLPGVRKGLMGLVWAVFGLILFLLFLAALLSNLDKTADPLGQLLAMALVSIGAYYLREYRLRRRDSGPRISGAERTPVLPPVEGEQ